MLAAHRIINNEVDKNIEAITDETTPTQPPIDKPPTTEQQ